jgi:hypothetical protein
MSGTTATTADIRMRMLSFFFLLPIAALVALLLLGPRLWRTLYGPWIICGIVLGAIAIAGLSLYGIFHSTSSTAAIGILFVPFGMIFGGVAGAILGFAAFQAVHLRQRMRQSARAGAVSVVSLGLLIFCVLYSAQQLRRIQSFYRYQRADNAEALASGAVENLSARDYFVLSAIAANTHTPADALLRIANNPDPELHRKRHEWIDMFDRDQLAVMRKVVRNPHCPTEVLPILALSPDDYVLADVCGDKRASESILRQRCAPRDVYLVHWSLARNPSAPADLLAALPRTKDKYVAHGLAYNPSTPSAILRELAKHDDPLVRQGVAVNPSADKDLLTALSRDPVDYMSRQARERLNSQHLQ